MSYQHAIARMYALGHELANTPSAKFDLDHMRVLLQALEHPERRFPSVLIAGTNGKGSTAATLASIAAPASGHQHRPLHLAAPRSPLNERIRVHGAAISDDRLCWYSRHRVDRTAERLVQRARTALASQLLSR